MFIFKFDHISYRSISANLQSLQFVTSVITHAYCYFHHQLVVKEWKDTFTVILKWIYVISQNNSFVVFSVKHYGRDELKIKQYGEQLNSHQVTLSCDIASFALRNFFCSGIQEF